MAKRNALGRGLGALIETEDKDGKIRRDAVNEIPLSEIEANPFQPRSKFDEIALNELADSIKELGIIQPLTVRLLDDKFQLISGERRLRAAKIAGLKTVPAYVRTADDQGLLEMALVENIQRENLCKLTQETLSDRVGKKRSTVANYLRLLSLPPEIQLGIREKKISMGHARAIINLKDTDTQMMVYDQILKYDFSVRKVEEFVRELNTESAPVKVEKKDKKMPVTESEYEKLQAHLSGYFHTDVKFLRNAKGKGKIVIPFNDDEQLERIIAALDKLDK